MAQTYGICEGCQGDIPYKRLKARPVTTLCIECKTSQEEAESLLAECSSHFPVSFPVRTGFARMVVPSLLVFEGFHA